MIYTLGKKSFYEDYIDTEEFPAKLGRLDPRVPELLGVDFYEGGSVWLTKDEAQRYCKEGYGVYGVKAEWETDTMDVGEPYRVLLHTRELTKL